MPPLLEARSLISLVLKLGIVYSTQDPFTSPLAIDLYDIQSPLAAYAAFHPTHYIQVHLPQLYVECSSLVTNLYIYVQSFISVHRDLQEIPINFILLSVDDMIYLCV